MSSDRLERLAGLRRAASDRKQQQQQEQEWDEEGATATTAAAAAGSQAMPPEALEGLGMTMAMASLPRLSAIARSHSQRTKGDGNDEQAKNTASSRSDDDHDHDQNEDRTKARVTLMRKLSERRLQASTTSSTNIPTAKKDNADSTQHGSNGNANDDEYEEWRKAATQRALQLQQQETPRQPDEWTDNPTPTIAQSQHALLLRQHDNQPQHDEEEHDQARHHRSSSVPAYLSSGFPSPPDSPHRPTGPATFGIAAVEGRDVYDPAARRRGSSASSTLALLDAASPSSRKARLGSLGEQSRLGSSFSLSIASNAPESPRSSSSHASPSKRAWSQERPSIDQAFATASREISVSMAEHIMRRHHNDRRRHSYDSARGSISQPHFVARLERPSIDSVHRRSVSPLAYPSPSEDAFSSPPLNSFETPKQSDDTWPKALKATEAKSLFERRSPIIGSSGSSERESPIFTPSFKSLPTFAGAGAQEPLVSPHSMIPPEMMVPVEEDSDNADPLAIRRAQIANETSSPTVDDRSFYPTPPPARIVDSVDVSRSVSPASFYTSHSKQDANGVQPPSQQADYANTAVPVQRQPAVPTEPPGKRILQRLDEILGTSSLESSSSTPLDQAPRKLLLETPVLQVVNAYTVKDRHLFLFSDCLLIAKPIIEDDPVTGQPVYSNLNSSFLVKSIVELRHLKLHAGEEPQDEADASASSSSKKKHPLLVTFIDRFANDPKRAINSLIHRGGLSSDAATIANLLFRNTDLNRNQLGAYLANPDHRPVLRAYIDRFRLAGVRLDDALRTFLMSLRLPHNVSAVEYVLGILAMQWSEANSSLGFDPTLTFSLTLAIMKLSDALHAGKDGAEDGLFSFPNRAISVEDFVSAFRQHDPRDLVPEDLLARIYNAVSKERIEPGNDNSIFSMTPDIEVTMQPAKLPSRLTYKVPSQYYTITIPEADPKFHIKLHGIDLKFEPAHLVFTKSRTQSFRVTGTALGMRAMVFIKLGANAPRYQGLPVNKAFSIERAFMQHTFQLSFVNHLDVKRKYMFSTMDSQVRTEWLKQLRDLIVKNVNKPPAPSKAIQAGEAVAIQVLRDALIAPEPRVAVVNAAAPSPRPGSAGRFGTVSHTHPSYRAGGGRLGTPTRGSTPLRSGTATNPTVGLGVGQIGGQALVRSNSFSRTYAAGIGRAESDLIDDSLRRKGGANTSAAMASNTSNLAVLSSGTHSGGGGSSSVAGSRRGSKDDSSKVKADPFCKRGEEIVTITEQNSLLPIVLSFLGTTAAIAKDPNGTVPPAFPVASSSSASTSSAYARTTAQPV